MDTLNRIGRRTFIQASVAIAMFPPFPAAPEPFRDWTEGLGETEYDMMQPGARCFAYSSMPANELAWKATIRKAKLNLP